MRSRNFGPLFVFAFNFPRALNNLGGQLAGMEAVELSAKGRHPPARFSRCPQNNLGSALSKIPGRLPEAIAQYQFALQLEPDFRRAAQQPAKAFSQTPPPDGRRRRGSLKAALRSSPDSRGFRAILFLALARMGRKNEAIPHFEVACGSE